MKVQDKFYPNGPLTCLCAAGERKADGRFVMAGSDECKACSFYGGRESETVMRCERIN